MSFQDSYQYGLPKGDMISLLGDNPKVFIELGASNGVDTKQFLERLGSEDKYIAVEADPRNIERFVIKDKRLELIHAAVTNEDGEGVLHMCTGIIPSLQTPHYDGSSLRHATKETYKHEPWLSYQDVTVPFIKLDTLTKNRNINKVDFIWCDVEGQSGEVIDGGLETLKNTKYFYTEINKSVEYSYQGQLMYPELVKKLKTINFELVFEFKSDALFKNTQ